MNQFVPLCCPVRGCGLPLDRLERSWTCARGHAFDVARSGYVNLLQPQDRRSATAGDSKGAIDARARLLDGGIGRTILDAVGGHAVACLRDEYDVVVDLGCGSGDAIGTIHARRPIIGIGLDLSSFAVDRAARRFGAHTWVVANADRRLPVLDASVSLVVSLHGRRNSGECARVLQPGGSLLVAVPAAADLIELRASVQGAQVERDRISGVIAEHDALFTVIDRGTSSEHHRLAGAQLRDLLRGTYRGERASQAGRVEALEAMDLTLASDFVVLRKS